ncbi:hypothetical protein BHE74_00044765 [Ensete ventricosum]|nr:hypothetical protein BHE74_00044765 [Ensete ventricosum]RZR84604.1 hypothetical protein BHM03_00011457 [Ensete ventricosum]
MVFASSLTCWADPSLYPNLGPPEPPLLSSICISVDADASDNGGSGKSSDDPIMQSGDEVGGVLLVDASGIAMITDLIVVGGGQFLSALTIPMGKLVIDYVEKNHDVSQPALLPHKAITVIFFIVLLC